MIKLNHNDYGLIKCKVNGNNYDNKGNMTMVWEKLKRLTLIQQEMFFYYILSIIRRIKKKI